MATDANDPVLCTVQDHIMVLTLNRPQKKNAINAEMAKGISDALEQAKTDPGIRVVVIGAAGDTFCAGGDLSMMSQQQASGNAADLPSLALGIRQLHKPVLIKAQGAVLAGALLLVCNATHVLAADHVTFSLPEIKRGLFPFMVMAGLLRVMPRRAAIDFAMRGYRIDAHKAEQWGLINQAVPAAELDQATDQLAREIASLSPSAIRLGLEACDHQESLSFEKALPYLGEMLQKTLATEDAREGISAFLEKREPHWTGR